MMDLPRVLFVSWTRRLEQPYLDPSVRYRCFNPAEDIRHRGGTADVVAIGRFQPAMVQQYDHVVFHRPHADERLTSALAAVREQGKTCHADYDDLIFNPACALHCSVYLNGLATRQQVEDLFQRNYQAFGQFERFTVSTEPLARHVRELNPAAEVSVIRNGLSTTLFDSLRLNPAPRPRDATRFLISYLPGTESHAPDFAFIQEPLAELLHRDPRCCLVIMGPLKLDESIFPYESCFRLQYLPYTQFLRYAGAVSLNLAPLAPGNEFNECKSGLKFFESGIFGVPTIASPLEDFARFSESPGLLLPSSPLQWGEAFARMRDREQYATATHGLFDYCWSNCRSETQTAQLLEFLQGVLR